MPDAAGPVADVAVIGAGPAGLAAACLAAERGASVVMLDEAAEPGGQIWRHRPGDDVPVLARRWLARVERSGAARLAGATVVDVDSSGNAGTPFRLLAERGGRVVTMGARCLVVATGARERWIPFPGWTLPGVVGIGGAQALLKSGAATAIAGRRVVIAGSGPLLLPVAASLVAAGARILEIAEQAPLPAVLAFAAGLWREPSTLLQALRYQLRLLRPRSSFGTWPVRADGTSHLQSVTLGDGRSTRMVACDLLCTGFGLVPNIELAALLGCELDRGTVRVGDLQETTVAGVFCAGEPTGVGGVDLSLAEGEIAGVAAATLAGAEGGTAGDGARQALHATARADREVAVAMGRRWRLRARARRMDRAFAPRPELRTLATPGTIVCRCEDVRLDALQPGWSPRQAKLYARAGMGPCQGRVCGPALELLFGWAPGTVRPPLAPARVSTLLAAEAPASPAAGAS
jgi:NADPH-dependent 2,4-dienoyl-CoA reductase/sulfur reductase-like enzyme